MPGFYACEAIKSVGAPTAAGAPTVEAMALCQSLTVTVFTSV